MKHPVSAIVVTRGDVPLEPVLAPLHDAFDEVLVWDNSDPARHDWKVYGRYAAIIEARNDLIYVQDDDVIVPRESLDMLVALGMPRTELKPFDVGSIRHYVEAPSALVIAANMPERFRAHYSDSCLIGFGAIFDRLLPFSAFARYGDVLQLLNDDTFLRCCDVVFTTLTPSVWVDAPYEELPYASADNRMWKQPIHVPERAAVLARARMIRDA